MPETRLFLVRHGSTTANLVRPYILQGLRPDPELSALGVAEARAAARALASAVIVHVYASPLKRAHATAQVIAEALGVPLTLEQTLVEADIGLWSGLTWEEVERRWPEERRAFEDDPERHGYLGGENLAQVRDRVLPRMEELAERHRGAAFAVVGHGVVNRVLLAHWSRLPLKHARRLPHDNGGINIVTWDDDTPKVRTINAIGHLLGA